MWWDYGTGWGGLLGMVIGMAGFWILVALLLVVLFQSSRQTGSDNSPREILERRLARGEIGVEEYRQRLDALSKTRQ